MMEKEQLRRADFITSIILILFALWMLSQALQMPMRDTFGGVTNVWYVSPALVPLIISTALFVLGVVLLAHSIRTGGAAGFIARIRNVKAGTPESFIRFGAILLAFLSFVYLDIPRIDFFLSTVLFLFFFIAAFYFDEDRILHRLSIFYLAAQVLIVVVFATGLSNVVNRAFAYSTDVLALAILVAMIVYVRRLAGGEPASRKRFRITAIVAFATPLVLVPIFRYGLRVPLPREGGIVEIFNLVYYSLR